LDEHPLVSSDLHRADCDVPHWTKTTAIEQDSWAFFEPQIAAVTVTDHAPVHVRDNMIERDIILTHQSGCELRGAVNGVFACTR